jgi:hypothetical protein
MRRNVLINNRMNQNPMIQRIIISGRQSMSMDPFNVRNWISWAKQFESVRYFPQAQRCQIIANHLKNDGIVPDDDFKPKMKRKNAEKIEKKIEIVLSPQTQEIQKLENVEKLKEEEEKKLKVELENKIKLENEEQLEIQKIKLELANKKISELRESLEKTRDQWYQHFKEITKNQQELMFKGSEEAAKIIDEKQLEWKSQFEKEKIEMERKLKLKTSKIENLKQENEFLQSEFDLQNQKIKNDLIYLTNQKGVITENLSQISLFLKDLKNYEYKFHKLTIEFEKLKVDQHSKISEILNLFQNLFQKVLQRLIEYQNESFKLFSTLKSKM